MRSDEIWGTTDKKLLQKIRHREIPGEHFQNREGTSFAERKLMNTKNVVLMGMFGALVAVLMLFEVPPPFLAPSFMDLILQKCLLVGTFALGPVAGICDADRKNPDQTDFKANIHWFCR